MRNLDTINKLSNRMECDVLTKKETTTLRQAIIKILLSQKPSKYFLQLDKLGTLNKLFPELVACKSIAQEIKYHKYDVFQHCISAMDHIEPNLTLRLAVLFHDVGKAQVVKIINNKITFHKHEIASAKIAEIRLKRFGFSKTIIKDVSNLIKLHMFHYTDAWSDAAIRRFIKKIGVDKTNINNLNNHPVFKIRRADRLGKGMNIKEDEVVTVGQKALQAKIKIVFYNDRPRNS